MRGQSWSYLASRTWTEGSRRTQSTTHVGCLEAAGALGVVAVRAAVADDEHASALAAAGRVGRHVCGGVVVSEDRVVVSEDRGEARNAEVTMMTLFG